jgi:hypothetical protein
MTAKHELNPDLDGHPSQSPRRSHKHFGRGSHHCCLLNVVLGSDRFLQAAHSVSKDLDLISETFAGIKSTMENATNFEGLTPRSKPFRHRLMDVFTSLLDFCAHATEIFKNHGRVRKYLTLKFTISLCSLANRRVFRALLSCLSKTPCSGNSKVRPCKESHH